MQLNKKLQIAIKYYYPGSKVHDAWTLLENKLSLG